MLLCTDFKVYDSRYMYCFDTWGITKKSWKLCPIQSFEFAVTRSAFAKICAPPSPMMLLLIMSLSKFVSGISNRVDSTVQPLIVFDELYDRSSTCKLLPLIPCVKASMPSSMLFLYSSSVCRCLVVFLKDQPMLCNHFFQHSCLLTQDIQVLDAYSMLRWCQSIANPPTDCLWALFASKIYCYSSPKASDIWRMPSAPQFTIIYLKLS